jgi:hypothetical protein
MLCQRLGASKDSWVNTLLNKNFGINASIEHYLEERSKKIF